jgi:hypothetical protein
LGRIVNELDEGQEFLPNRFIAGKSQHGCYVEYESQDGSRKRLRDPSISRDLYLGKFTVVEQVVDFVPDDCRELWNKLQSFGPCWLSYTGSIWLVEYEHPMMNIHIDNVNGQTQAEIIVNVFDKLCSMTVINNGVRWFHITEDKEVKKISDKEATKLKGLNNAQT